MTDNTWRSKTKCSRARGAEGGSTTVAAALLLLHINGTGAASRARSTWTAYVVLQKSFDPGARRSPIEFHEMKPPLHASLGPFRKAPIGREFAARGTA